MSLGASDAGSPQSHPSSVTAVLRQIVEGQPSDPSLDEGVLATLDRNDLLGEWLGLLPGEALREQRWRGQFRRIQFGAMQLAATGATVSSTLQDGGVPHVVYKGVATTALLGHDWHRRQSADVDVLVSRSRLEGALSVLADAGWEVVDGYHVPNRLRSYAYCELSLDRAGILVDLHWRVNASPLVLRIPTETLIESAVDTSLGSSTVPTLNHEHAALVIAVHGTRELWCKGKFILDLARAVSVLDPEYLRRLAVDAGAEKALAIGCAALFALAPNAVPDALRPGTKASRRWQEMRQASPNPLTRRVLKARSRDSLASGLDDLARSIVGQVVPT